MVKLSVYNINDRVHLVNDKEDFPFKIKFVQLNKFIATDPKFEFAGEDHLVIGNYETINHPLIYQTFLENIGQDINWVEKNNWKGPAISNGYWELEGAGMGGLSYLESIVRGLKEIEFINFKVNKEIESNFYDIAPSKRHFHRMNDKRHLFFEETSCHYQIKIQKKD